MGIEINQSFDVDAPIDEVWAFVTDPRRVASCMPGASLDEIIDERNFRGSIRVKVGAITAAYKGKVEMTGVDESSHAVEIHAAGTETGGETAKASMKSSLARLDGGGTRVVAEASVELTGKIMQMGRGMIQGVSDQLFEQFAGSARAQLEGGAGAEAAVTVDGGKPLRVVPLLFAALWSAITGLLRRVFGRGAAKEHSG